MTKIDDPTPNPPTTDPLESSADPAESFSVILLIAGAGLIGLTCWRVGGLVFGGEPGGPAGDQLTVDQSAAVCSHCLTLCGHAVALLFGVVCCIVGSLLRWA